ncbi:MAG TPA: Gfo/Idh/MocA family oxidoreductase [Gaiellaceae bacterium]|nr:Gfo/Idh/MocA family oxidoreductase [Gaiellaceae bacterium]
MRSLLARRSRSGDRFLLVGYGTRGRQWEGALRRARYAVAGIVDPDPAAAASARAAGHESWLSLAAALGAADADIAIVASPPAAHVEDACACLEHGLAVLLEKPAALDVAGIRSVEAAARSAERPVVVGQNFRFLPREAGVARGLSECGAVVSISILSARPASVAAAHLADVRNGPLWDIVLHHVDALRCRFGEPEKVEASRASIAGSARSELVLRYGWASGLWATVTHVEGAPAFHHHEWLETEDAAIIVDDQRVFVQRMGRRRKELHVSARNSPERAVLDELATARAGGRTRLEVSDNLHTIAAVEAAQLSLELGRPVELRDVLVAGAVA